LRVFGTVFAYIPLHDEKNKKLWRFEAMGIDQMIYNNPMFFLAVSLIAVIYFGFMVIGQLVIIAEYVISAFRKAK